MADQLDTPLTDDERAELEALRAEKARRERAELEALRAEQEAAKTAPSAAEPVAPAPAAPQPQQAPAAPQAVTASQPQASATPATAPAPQPAPAASFAETDTFGRRMVLSQGEDEDGIPEMPPAQKILIAVCLIVALCVGAYVVMNNMGML